MTSFLKVQYNIILCHLLMTFKVIKIYIYYFLFIKIDVKLQFVEKKTRSSLKIPVNACTKIIT